MLDVVAAVEWVRDNAASFGGDPENVALFGESGGGSKVAALLSMRRAQGLFHRAIVQSSGSGMKLADTEEALARLSAGNYGWCESCAGAISAQRLVTTPETRYCARCAQEPRAEAPAQRAPAVYGDRLAARSPHQEQAR